MAVQAKLVRREDTTATGSDVSSISLLSNTNGFDLEYYDGWTQAVAQGMTPGNLTETFNLIAKGTSHDNLAANLQGLDDKLKEAEWYWDDAAERYGVWLRAQLTNETKARQALIRRGEGQPGESLYGPYVDQGKTIRRYALALERLPWWEATATTNFTASNLKLSGTSAQVQAEYGTIPGDVPARPAIVTMVISSIIGGFHEFWMGFRTNRFGDRTNFEAVWQCEDGGVENSTTDEGTYVQCTFTGVGQEAMLTRNYISIANVTSDESDQRGNFIVLLRAQLSAASTTCNVRLADGYETLIDQCRIQDRVKIDSDDFDAVGTDWRLYSLGTIQIPPLAGRASDNLLEGYRMRIQAERTTGAGSLRMDKLILIPYGEGGLYGTNAWTSHTSPGRIYERPDGTVNGWAYHNAAYDYATYSMALRPQGPYGFTMPVGAGRVVFAGQLDGKCIEDASIDIDFTYTALPRWRTLRGSDG